jgi:predicted nuclease of restriction endonuclease-like RecB superfamily
MRTITKENNVKAGDKVTIVSAQELVKYEGKSWFTPELLAMAGKTVTVTRNVANGQKILVGNVRVAYAAMSNHIPQSKIEEMTKGTLVKGVDAVKRNSGTTVAKGRLIYNNTRPVVSKILGTNKWTVKALELVSKKYKNLNRVKELVAVLVVSELVAKHGGSVPVLKDVSNFTKLPLRAFVINELANMVIDKYDMDGVSTKVAEAFGISLDDVKDAVSAEA